ncbi:TPA: phage antirepressor KilAC domain-containing protein [Bacillus thuringiensis]|nr:phage antirepressor KilAC domain-containing protein [Bacillus thuringiensis]
MKNELTVIHEQEVLGQEFKIYGDNENPLFLAKDVAIWIEHSAVHMMMKQVDEDEKVRNIVSTLGGNQEMWFVTEDGLYEILMKSNKPIAKAFRKEVKQILKTIRKTGGYVNNTDLMVNTYFGSLPDTQKMLVKGLFENIEEQQRQLTVAHEKIETDAPKIDMWQVWFQEDGVYKFQEFGKRVGIGRNTLFKILKQRGILMENNEPYQKYMKYFKIKETQLPNGKFQTVTLITKNGCRWLYKGLKEQGYIN